MTEAELVGAIQARLEGSPIQGAQDPRPPVTEAEWATFEAAVGQPLPSLFRRVSEKNFFLLRFCDGGCTVFSVLDLSTGRVGLEDGDILWQTASLHGWFGRWLAGEQVMSFGASA